MIKTNKSLLLNLLDSLSILEENLSELYLDISKILFNNKKEIISKIFSELSEEEVLHKNFIDEEIIKIKNIKSDNEQTKLIKEYDLTNKTKDLIVKLTIEKKFINKILNNAKSSLENIKDELSAINFAINIENDVLNLYKLIESVVSKDQKDTIIKISNFEKEHLLKLTNAKYLVLKS